MDAGVMVMSWLRRQFQIVGPIVARRIRDDAEAEIQRLHTAGRLPRHHPGGFWDRNLTRT